MWLQHLKNALSRFPSQIAIINRHVAKGKCWLRFAICEVRWSEIKLISSDPYCHNLNEQCLPIQNNRLKARLRQYQECFVAKPCAVGNINQIGKLFFGRAVMSVITLCWWRINDVGDCFIVKNRCRYISNRLPTSHSCHQHKPFPTYVTNIEVAWFYSLSFLKGLPNYISNYQQEQVNLNTEGFRKGLW